MPHPNQEPIDLKIRRDHTSTLFNALNRYWLHCSRQRPGSKAEIKRIEELFKILQDAGFDMASPHMWHAPEEGDVTADEQQDI